MFGSGNKSDNTQTGIANKEIQERFFTFLSKLEDRLKEFAEASVPELESLRKSDPDEFNRAYHRMKSGVLGQLDSVRNKAADVKEEKIDRFDLPGLSGFSSFRSVCYDRYAQFEKIYNHYRAMVEDTDVEDFEIKYQRILDEYETSKDKFRCMQCGSPVVIGQLYFTTTYITCPSCQTRNTYDPGTNAKMLEHVGRSLAEQRTRHLLKEHDSIGNRTHDLYLQAHQLELSLIHEKDNKVIDAKKKVIESLHQQKKELEERRPLLYTTYLRAMFDEWNKINPALADEHEKFHTRLVNDYKQYKL